jgi:hypothetical protein
MEPDALLIQAPPLRARLIYFWLPPLGGEGWGGGMVRAVTAACGLAEFLAMPPMTWPRILEIDPRPAAGATRRGEC